MEMAPAWAKTATGEEPGQEGMVKTKRPDTVTFLAALDNFSLAAHACGVSSWHAFAFPICRFVSIALQVWDYGAARTHARILMQVGACAGHEDRRHVLMQCYDEVVRKDWAEKARRGDVGFDVNKASLTLDLEALNSARHLYDTLYPKPVKSADSHRMRGSGRPVRKFAYGIAI